MSSEFKVHAVLDSLPDSLLRAKGVLNLVEEPAHRTVYQRVGKRWSYARAEAWGDEPAHSNLVLVGPVGALDQSRLEASLESCIADDN